MQVRCVRAFGLHMPGDLAEVPDGAVVDPVHYEPVTAASAPPALPAAASGISPAAAVTPKEGA